MIEISHEELYQFDLTLSCLTFLKILHEVGVDVKKHAKSFRLHNSYTYGGYADVDDIYQLAELILPHLFDVETHGIKSSALSFSNVEPVIRDIIENLDMPEHFNKEKHIEEGEVAERFYVYVYEGEPGTFNFINWDALEKASNPFHFNEDYKNAGMTYLTNHYRDRVEGKKTYLHQIEEDNFLTTFYFTTQDCSRFVVYFDASDIFGETDLTFTGLMLAELRRQFI